MANSVSRKKSEGGPASVRRRGRAVEAGPESAFSRGERARKNARRDHFDRLANQRDSFRQRNAGYHDEILRLVRFTIRKGCSILEIGSSTGELLAGLEPSRGLGIDFSPRSVELARSKFEGSRPELEFRVGDAESLEIDETFDYVVMSDVVGYLDDVWTALRSLRRVMRPDSRLVLTCYNSLWESVLALGERLGRKMPAPTQNWLERADIENILSLADLEVVSFSTSTLLPLDIPVVAPLANRLLARAPGFDRLSLLQCFVARPVWQHRVPSPAATCTVVVPCRNERGNVEAIFERTPELGAGTELIFVDGNSTDGTVEEIERLLPTRPGTRLILQGDGTGKGDAVRKGFDAAKNDLLFILDADLTVPPEDLPKFYSAVVEGHAELANGSRLVYPMEGEAMRFLNHLGNQFFSKAFTHILGRQLNDTLCGTKVLTRTSYQKIVAGRAYFGEFDPFGDFDLIFGAARAGLAIRDVAVRYRARTYGDTKISRFRHGLVLLRMTAIAYQKFKLDV